MVGVLEGIEFLSASNPLGEMCFTCPVFIVWSRTEDGGQQDMRVMGANLLKVSITCLSMALFCFLFSCKPQNSHGLFMLFHANEAASSRAR